MFASQAIANFLTRSIRCLFSGWWRFSALPVLYTWAFRALGRVGGGPALQREKPGWLKAWQSLNQLAWRASWHGHM